jgi:hypothetical protein
LLNAFRARIKQTEAAGKITTWEISEDGKYYTHKAADWAKKAWFSASPGVDRLTFNIIKPKNATVKMLVYGYYHGHLIETFLNHFDQSFSSGCATALPAAGDLIS